MKSSGRSGRSAASYRRRLNEVAEPATAASEIDLREDLEPVGAGTRPSRLTRDLRIGESSTVAPTSTPVRRPPPPPAGPAPVEEPVARTEPARRPSPLLDPLPAASAPTRDEPSRDERADRDEQDGPPPSDGPPSPPRARLGRVPRLSEIAPAPDEAFAPEPKPEPPSTSFAADANCASDPVLPEPASPRETARRQLLSVLAGASVVGVMGAIASACGTGGGTEPNSLRGLAAPTTTTAPGAPRRSPSLPSTQPPSTPDSTVPGPTDPTPGPWEPSGTKPRTPGGRDTGRRPTSSTPWQPQPGGGTQTSPGVVDPGAPPAPGNPPPPAPPPAPDPSDPALEALRQARLIERITFGPTPQLVDQVSRMGAAAFLEQQLSLAPAGIDGVLSGPTILAMTPQQVRTALDGQNADRRVAEELRHAAVVRAVTHPGQLAEMMVAFWSNHFSTYSGEDDKNVKYASAAADASVIRPHAMGRFADMVLASARSVAMQYYLDNFRSNATSPNQNYARELMELHTMGAGNGYDEGDVDQVSRLLSGWGLAGNIGRDEEVTFAFDSRRHSTEPISVTIVAPNGTVQTWSSPGRTAAAGEQDGVDFIDWLTHLPNTARYVSAKLARRFVGDNVSQALVDSMAQVYLANDTQIVPVLRHMFTSAEFEASRRTKTKTPFELLVGMLRATGATIDRTAGGPATGTIGGRLDYMGHGMWSWPTPDGFPEDPGFWVTTSTVLRRWEVTGRLTNNRLNGLTVDLGALMPSTAPATVGQLVQAVAMRLGTGVDETIVSAISTFLGAPHDAPLSEIDVERVRGDLVALLFSVPSYQYR